MKLNVDCIRAVLIEIEKLPLGSSLEYGDILNALRNDYSEDDIIYTCIKLKEAGYIEARIRSYSNKAIIFSLDDLTYDGHEFLNSIRDDKIWKKVKENSKAIGVESLHAIMDIAKVVISAYIQTGVS